MKTAFPWYDSLWLTSYVRAKQLIQESYPNRLREFISAFDVLRTDPRFETKRLQQLFTPAQHESMRRVIRELQQSEYEKHEMLRFGRYVVHNHEFFNALQQTITDVVSEAVNEDVQPSYNFLSLYNNLGVLRPHLDAPGSKWTVDYCVEQSAQWPIYISQVRPWPEDATYGEGDWEAAVKSDPEIRFTSYELQEGQAIVFGGSSQWHYRDRIQQKTDKNFCHLIFFHFIPRGSGNLTRPGKWAELFGIPELSEVIVEDAPRRNALI